MDLLLLKYFQTVARLGHMTKAAEVLNVAQPALSRTIRRLEAELNVKLFDRSGRSIRLNEYGNRFLAKVDTALQTLEDGRQELLDMTERPTGTISLYIQVASYLIPDIISLFRKKHPEVQFRLLQHDLEIAGDPSFDLCISTSPFRIPGTDSVPILTEELLLAVPTDHKLANRKNVELSELSNEGFISLKPGKRLRETTDALCSAAGFTPRIIFECDDPSMVRSLVRSGLGVSFIPSITWDVSQGSSVVLISIEEPVCTRTIELSWYPDRYMTRAAIYFKEFVQDYFRRLADARSSVSRIVSFQKSHESPPEPS
jgi:LysR family transcriptional activator of glutamate synthase operon